MSVRALDTNSPAPFAPTPAVTPSRRQCAKKQSTKQWDMGPEVAVFARWVTPPSTTPPLTFQGTLKSLPHCGGIDNQSLYRPLRALVSSRHVGR